MRNTTRSKASRADTTDSAVRRARGRALVRSGITGLLALTTAGLVFGGAFFLWQRAAQAKAAAEQAQARREGLVADRKRVDENGVPLLMGPLSPEGPTWGKSEWADIDWLENRWFYFGRDGAWETDPNTRRFVLLRIRNKSGHTLYQVQAPIELYTDAGYLRTDVCTLGDAQDGMMRRKTCGPLPEGVTVFRVLGFKARQTPGKNSLPPTSKSDRTE